MTVKTLIIAGVVALTPMMSFAMGCQNGHSEQASSCAEGTAWDADLGACVPSVSS